MTATFNIKEFQKYEKVVAQFLDKGKGLFNTTAFKIEFKENNTIILYYTGSSSLAEYTLNCVHDIPEKIISTDYYKLSQIIKALSFEGSTDISFNLEETDTGAIIKIDAIQTHIDLPAFIIYDEFAKILPYEDHEITCSFEEESLYEATKIAAGFLNSGEIGSSVFVNSTVISNDERFVYVAKKTWNSDLEGVSISKQNLDIYNILKKIDENAEFHHVDSDRTFVTMSSEDKNFFVQLIEPTPIIDPPTEEQLEMITSNTKLTEISVGQLSSIINFFLSTGIFDNQKWFPLTIQSFPEDNKIKFTVKNTEYASIPALNIEKWIDNVPDLSVEVEDTISADILKVFLSLLDESIVLTVYTDSESNGIRLESPEKDLYLAKFS